MKYLAINLFLVMAAGCATSVKMQVPLQYMDKEVAIMTIEAPELAEFVNILLVSEKKVEVDLYDNGKKGCPKWGEFFRSNSEYHIARAVLVPELYEQTFKIPAKQNIFIKTKSRAYFILGSNASCTNAMRFFPEPNKSYVLSIKPDAVFKFGISCGIKLQEKVVNDETENLVNVSSAKYATLRKGGFFSGKVFGENLCVD